MREVVGVGRLIVYTGFWCEFEVDGGGEEVGSYGCGDV